MGFHRRASQPKRSTLPQGDVPPAGNFQRRKLRLALVIMGIGMAVALVWHGWQGWGLQRGYPHNSFLLPADLRFGDLTSHIGLAAMASPYLSYFGMYFPPAYLFFSGLGLMPQWMAETIFVVLSVVGSGAAVLIALRPLYAGLVPRLVCTAILLGCSFPFVFGVDRGNIETLLALSVAIALLLFRGHRFNLGLVFLFLALAAKCYPALLLALFIRPRHLGKIPVVLTVFFIITVLCLASYTAPVSVSMAYWGRDYQFFNDYYLINDDGLSGGASLWNTYKALYLGELTLDNYNFDLTLPPFEPGQNFPYESLKSALAIYNYLAIAAGAVVTLFSVLVEREFYRRAVLLLLLLALCVPSGADYRLLYAEIALVVLILIPSQRRHDLLVAGLLAFVLVPKKQFLLPYLGRSDVGVDVCVSILLNPPCMLVAIILLMRAGIYDGAWFNAKQRTFGLLRTVQRSCVTFWKE